VPVHNWSKVEAGVFHGFHHFLITTINTALNSGILPPDYYALPDQVVGPGHPDVLGLERVSQPESRPSSNGATAGGAAVAVAPAARFEETSDRTPKVRRRKQVVIRHISGDRVVAIVEIVSPSNKDGPLAVRDFARKMDDYLAAGIHLLVVDLLRPGPADPNGLHPVIWKPFKKKSRFALPADKPLTAATYAAGDPARAFVEPFGVGDRLPDVPLFLTSQLHVRVPLEAAYEAAWALVPQRWRDELAPPA
jgi:hypothetical protein